MNYKQNEFPNISEFYSFQNDFSNDRVICTSGGLVKVLNCSYELLEEVLSYVDGCNTFEQIEMKFTDRYPIRDVQFFLNEILSEKLIVINKDSTDEELCKILVIGDGRIFDCFQNYSRTSIDNFLHSESKVDCDVVIFVPSIASYEKILKINKILYKLNIPYIQISFNGEYVTAGPLVVPGKSACLQCGIEHNLKRINTKLELNEKLDLQDLYQLNATFKVPELFNTSKLEYIADFVSSDLTTFSKEVTSQFLDAQYSFSSSCVSCVRDEMLPTTECSNCHAFNSNYIFYNKDSMTHEKLLKVGSRCEQISTPLSNEKIVYETGGLRSLSEDETKIILEKELAKLGTSVKIEPAIGNPFNDSNTIHCYNSFVDQSMLKNSPYLFRKNEGAGKGLTKMQSFFSASFELLEHMSLQYTGDIPIICAKYSDVREIAIDMNQLSKTILNKNTSFANFDENLEIDWVVAKSLTTNEKKLVPAFMVFMYDIELKGTLYGGSSNGAGSGLTIEDAILHGLFEAIERDSWLIGQSNSFVHPLVDYSSITNHKLIEIISSIKGLGYDIITRDYTNDLQIPVFRTWIVDQKDFSRYAYMGFGCHISPEIALERSITEAVQIDDWSSTGGAVDQDMITPEVLYNSLISIYNQHHLVNQDILGVSPKQPTIISKPIFEVSSTYDAIKKTTNLINSKTNGDVYYVEMTKPGSNIKVARTVVTGDFQQMNIPMISVCERMFKFGINCGYSNKKTTYQELFLGKYQH